MGLKKGKLVSKSSYSILQGTDFKTGARYLVLRYWIFHVDMFSPDAIKTIP